MLLQYHICWGVECTLAVIGTGGGPPAGGTSVGGGAVHRLDVVERHAPRLKLQVHPLIVRPLDGLPLEQQVVLPVGVHVGVVSQMGPGLHAEAPGKRGWTNQTRVRAYTHRVDQSDGARASRGGTWQAESGLPEICKLLLVGIIGHGERERDYSITSFYGPPVPITARVLSTPRRPFDYEFL
eukprot:4144584-Pyramimonas_sp.AAC.2